MSQETRNFSGGWATDIADHLLPQGSYRMLYNMRFVSGQGSDGSAVRMEGNEAVAAVAVLLTAPLSGSLPVWISDEALLQ